MSDISCVGGASDIDNDNGIGGVDSIGSIVGVGRPRWVGDGAVAAFLSSGEDTLGVFVRKTLGLHRGMTSRKGKTAVDC